jgi:hypothetical protein
MCSIVERGTLPKVLIGSNKLGNGDTTLQLLSVLALHVDAALKTVPFPRGLFCKPDTRVVKPLPALAVVVVASNHLPK